MGEKKNSNQIEIKQTGVAETAGQKQGVKENTPKRPGQDA
jgi:hypothetical protein